MNDMQMLVDIAGMTEELINSGKLVSVIRCKDCKNRNSWECWQYFLGHKTEDNWFCADGKPKDGEQE